MKRFLLFMAIALFAINVTYASNENQQSSSNEISYEQALKALEERQFIIRFNTLDYRGQRRKHLDNETNFLILEGDSASYQYDDGRREYLHVGGGGTFYMFPDIEKGKASNITIKKDKKNNRVLSMAVKLKSMHSSFTVKIVLEEGTNNCIATLKNYWGNSYYKGVLYPIGTTTVLNAN